MWEQQCEVKGHTFWIQVRNCLETTSPLLQDQVMGFTAGKNADFLKVELFIVPSCMFSRWSRLGTDDDFPFWKIFCSDFHDLLEVLDEWVVFMESFLYLFQNLFQHLLLRFTHASWNVHILKTLGCLKVSIMYIELDKAWNLSFLCLQWANPVL